MKAELIEYHSKQARMFRNQVRNSEGFPNLQKDCTSAAEFHERAVEWLEGPRHLDLMIVWDGNAWVTSKPLNEREPKTYSK